MRILITMLAAGAATLASAQDVTFQARVFDNTGLGGTVADPFDNVSSFSSATSSFLIGNQPISIAYDGFSVYIGGNRNGSPDRVAVAEISDFFGSQGAKNVPGSDVPGTNVLGGQGYTGMDWSDEYGLIAALDRGSTSPNTLGNIDAPFGQVFRWQRDDPADFSMTLQGFADGIRGSSGPAFDFGFDGMGYSLSDGSMGPAIAIPVFGRVAPFGLDPVSFAPGDDLYGPDSAIYNLFISGASTAWRDYDIHPTTGLVVGRTNNVAILGDRTVFNGTTNLRSITPPGGEAPFIVNQNVEIIHNPACGVDMIVMNDRPSSADLSGDIFSRVLLYDLDGNPISYEIQLPDGSPADALIPSGSNIYNFFWHEPDQLLFVLDGINRLVFALELVCDAGGGCNAADVAAPNGQLDIADVVGYLQLFGAQDPQADLAAPNGTFDIADVVAFLQIFGAGCPE